MAVYAIGDVQGCFDDLMRLLERIHYDEKCDHLWFVGDLVNRGNDSARVLRFVKGLGEGAITVLGNHDLHLIAVGAGISKFRCADTFDDVINADDRDDLLDWLRYRPLLYFDERHRVAMAHAGIYPLWNLETARACAMEVERCLTSSDYRELIMHLYGDDPGPWSQQLDGWERLRFIVNCFTRMRYCRRDGTIDLKEKGSPGAQHSSLFPWFALREQLGDKCDIIFGHWSALGHYCRGGFYGLDTGCVWGGALTALRVDQPRVVYRTACAGSQRPPAW